MKKNYSWLGFLWLVIKSEDVTVVDSGETQSSKVVAAFNSISIKGAICSYIIWIFRIELRLELLWFINSSRYALGIIKRDLFTK